MGQLSLNLNRMIKPAKDSDKCDLQQIQNNDTSKTNLSLFEQRRLKGWWPCVVETSNSHRELAGKLELELEILTEEEALARPAGKGRDEPNQYPHLEPPK